MGRVFRKCNPKPLREGDDWHCGREEENPGEETPREAVPRAEEKARQKCEGKDSQGSSTEELHRYKPYLRRGARNEQPHEADAEREDKAGCKNPR